MCAQHTPRPHLTKRLVRNALVVVILGLVGVGAAAVISGSYQVRPVLSGSMRPGLAVGGVVITKRVPISTLRVRDVVVFHRPDHPQELVVHRIISLTRGAAGVIVQTQGDANDTRDPWKVTLRGTTAYRAVFSVPLVGYAAVWAHNPSGRETLLLIGLLLVLGAATASLVQRRRSTNREGSTSEDDGSEIATASLKDDGSETAASEDLDAETDVQSEVESAPATA